MDHNDIIKLIAQTFAPDDEGQQIATESSKTVFCSIQTVTRDEFFKAGQNGIKPVYKAVMFRFDYSDEEIVEYNGKRYSVYRTFQSSEDEIELYLNYKIGNA